MAGPDWYRNVPMQRLDDLRDVSVQAERLYLRLACGRFSTRTGLVRYRAADLAVECRLRPSEVDQAFADLAAARLLLWDKSGSAAYLLGFCSAFAPHQHDNRSAWCTEVVAFHSQDLASQAMKEIEGRKARGGPEGGQRGASAKPEGGPEGYTRADQNAGSRKQEQKQEAQVAAAPPPASPAQPLPGMEATKGKGKATKDKAAYPEAALLASLWNDPDCPLRGKAIVTERNIRQCCAIVRDVGEERLQAIFAAAKAHRYWSGNGASTPAFAKILSVEGWDAFAKDVDRTPSPAYGYRPEQPNPYQEFV